MSSVNPAFAATGRLRQLPGDPVASIVAPGFSGGVSSFVLGENADNRGATKNTIIGTNIQQTGAALQGDSLVAIGGNIQQAIGALASNNSVWIGWDIVFGDGGVAHGENVFIGKAIVTAGNNVNASVVIGNSALQTGGDATTIGASTNGRDECVTIGKSAVGCTLGVAVGNLANVGGATGSRGIAIGNRANATGANQIAIGPNINASAFANAVMIGRSSEVFEVNSWGLGGDQANGTDMQTLRLGPNTLAAYPGLSIFLPSAAAGANVPGPFTDIRGGISTGNAAAGGQLTLQSSLIGAAGGAYQAVIDVLRIQSGGTAGNPTIALLNQISTPGVAAGTLLNAPVAGNPTIWAEVFYNGVLRFIPMW